MSLNKNIFDRLSLKKKITLNRQNKISDQLSSESEKNASLIEQIKDLQNETKVDNSALRSGYFLKSQNWYSQKLIDELNQTETKQKFIQKELTELRKKNCC
jgi:alpha-N-acetylglucosamine transferase